MKSLSTILMMAITAFTSFSQDTDYYRKIYSRPIGTKPHTAESLLKTMGDVRISNRWYAGADGFLRNDKSTLSNDFDGLIGTQSPTISAWSAVVGWVSQEQWTLEAEYARSAIHNVLLINGDNPMRYNLENDKNSMMLRGKRRLLFGKSKVRRSAFWVGAGIGFVPNSGNTKDYMEFYGYREKGRRQGVDTLALTSETRTNSSWTGLAEVSAEYVVKVGRVVDMSFFARKQWGMGTSVTTDLAYFVNGTEIQNAQIKGDGTGWNFGVSLRYVFHLGYDFSSIRIK
ncbi:hypothetical protein [Dyadobacter bucti]|uniref:hypothetical protein n=1 Tax=Dyadobacter bucti TaxID=2572203 RepID=UPI003F7068FC